MMGRKRAFTLVELIGVVVILGLLMLLVFPNIMKQIRNSQNELDEATLHIIYSSASLYVQDHSNEYMREEGRQYCITIQVLVDGKYLEKGIIDQNKEAVSMEHVVKVHFSHENFEYSVVQSGECLSLDK